MTEHGRLRWNEKYEYIMVLHEVDCLVARYIWKDLISKGKKSLLGPHATAILGKRIPASYMKQLYTTAMNNNEKI